LTAERESLQKLLLRISEGSHEAESELIERYGEHIRAVVRSRIHSRLRPLVDSDDFVQSIWGSVVRIGPKLAAIDRSEQLIALLARIAQNKVIDEFRRRTGTQKHRLAAHGLGSELEAGRPLAHRNELPTASEVAIARERWEQLLENEPPRAHEIVRLRLAGCTNLEIAETLKINEKTVRRTIARLLEKDNEALD
jgi:RNA polymerase sigma factor (sigma-70 family)